MPWRVAEPIQPQLSIPLSGLGTIQCLYHGGTFPHAVVTRRLAETDNVQLNFPSLVRQSSTYN